MTRKSLTISCASVAWLVINTTPFRALALVLALVLVPFMASCSKPAPAEEPVRSVKLLTVGIESMTSGSEFAGEVRARVESRLGFRVAGKLVRRQVEIGQRVRPGKVIAQLDPLDFKLAIEAMRAQLLACVNDNWNESVKVLRLEVDQSKARALGVTSQAIAQASNTILSGTKVGLYRDGDKLIDIVLRQPLDERGSLTDVANAYLPTSSGRSIPMTQLIKPSLTWEPGVLWREKRDYAITVQGDIVEGMHGATVSAELLPALKALEAKWVQAGPGGYRIEVAGAVEESSKGVSSIATGFPIMLFITFTLLMLQLHSFSRAVLAFLTGFMGIAGVALALLVFDRPFGFVALLGVIALMGMIQRNSVILIDQIEQDRAAGIHPWDAIVESAVRRLRPIVLTAAAAVLAMIPLSRSVFWGRWRWPSWVG